MANKRIHLSTEGYRLFGEGSLQSIVHNANPDLVQEDIEEIHKLITIKYKEKERELAKWKKDAYQWWEKLREAFINGDLTK